MQKNTLSPPALSLLTLDCLTCITSKKRRYLSCIASKEIRSTMEGEPNGSEASRKHDCTQQLIPTKGKNTSTKQLTPTKGRNPSTQLLGSFDRSPTIHSFSLGFT